MDATSIEARTQQLPRLIAISEVLLYGRAAAEMITDALASDPGDLLDALLSLGSSDESSGNCETSVFKGTNISAETSLNGQLAAAERAQSQPAFRSLVGKRRQRTPAPPVAES